MAWGAVAGRSAELAEAVGGRQLCLFPPGRPRPPVLVRWTLSAAVTAGHILVRRPSAVVVTNPPLPAALVAWATGRAVGATVVLDSHPGGFGAQGDRVAARLQPLHRWLARRADLSLVAAEVWAERVRSWGGRALVVHEAPGDWPAGPTKTVPTHRHRRLRVLYVGRFAPDEPWSAVVAAAAGVPEIDVRVTGDPRLVELDPAEVPANVSLLGFLAADQYRREVLEADVVVSLTTEPGSVMRSACEAVWADRPLVVSDWPLLRELFPHAVHVANSPSALADGLRRAEAGYGTLADAAPLARRLQSARWVRQRQDLRSHLLGEV